MLKLFIYLNKADKPKLTKNLFGLSFACNKLFPNVVHLLTSIIKVNVTLSRIY